MGVSQSFPASEPTIGRAVVFELRDNPPLLAGITLGIVGYSAGHTALALGAGSLAAGLGGAASVVLPEAWARPTWAPVYFGLAGAFVKAASASLLAHGERSLAARTAARFRLRALGRLLGTGLTTPAPKVVAALSVHLREIESAVALGHLATVRSIAQLSPLVAALIVWFPRLSAAGILLAVPFGLGLSMFRRRARAAASRAQSLAEELECGVDELVRNADLWRAYGAGDRVVGVVAEASREAGRAAARVDLIRAALSGTNEILGVLAVLLALSFGARWGGASGATLLPFAALFFMGYRPLRDLGDARSWVTRGALGREVIGQLASPPAIDTTRSSAEEGSSPHAPGALELDRFGASARGPRTTLTLAPGQLACLIGPTGSGKSTLIRALLGLEPAVGTARWAGRDLTHAPAGPDRRPFAWVPQDAPLVTGSVIDNVMLVGASRADAARALAAVGAERLLEIPEAIGPGGRPLSGGERRLVSLARALASGQPAILLDEPTEGLDAEATRTVLAALAALRGKRTLLIATHRDDVCGIADCVVTIGERDALRTAAE